jgi:3-oxoacyl-[acyl-carrier protein] reductase
VPWPPRFSEQILRNYPPEFRKRESEHDIPVARYITGAVIPVDGGLRRYQF